MREAEHVVKYRFTRACAQLLVTVGFGLMVVVGVLAALTVVVSLLTDVIPWSRTDHPPSAAVLVGGGAAAVVAGILLGTPFVLAGELILAFLDQRRLLARIARRLRPEAAEDETVRRLLKDERPR